MKIIYSNEKYILDNELVATVGFFDGVHLGHRYLIEELKRKAKEQNRKSAVVTFPLHPRKVLNADFQPLLLTTFNEKLEQLEHTGIDLCIVLQFSLELSKLSAFDFLNDILYKQFNVRTLFVGHDHRFGHNRREAFDDYKLYGQQIGIEAIQAAQFSLPGFSHISSSDIRNALSAAEVSKANDMFGYKYSITGIVMDGFRIGRKIGFPTANLSISDNQKLIPASAVYAVKIILDGLIYSGMLNIGVKPTINSGLNKTIEVNIFDFNANIYNKEIKIIFFEKIRDEQKFNSLNELSEQLQNDKMNALKILELQK